MKTEIKSLFLLPILIAALGFIPAGRTSAQTLTLLYNFTATFANSPHTNGDGAYPQASLILTSNTLYGTAQGGGNFGNGAVFAINTDGTGFTNLHSFTLLAVPNTGTNSDGANPTAGLVLSGNTLFGTALFGGDFNAGTLFAVNTNGTGFTNLHNFHGNDGVFPNGLILSGNSIYGTAFYGGAYGNGTVFKVNTDGTSFTNLHSFTATSGPQPRTNSEGASPSAKLILSGNTLYGTAEYGGSSGVGTVFAVNIDGSGITNLHSFMASSTNSSGVYTNSDGANPTAGLILSGNTLYGTAELGGDSGVGTVFRINTDGTGFTNLHTLNDVNDGARPQGDLILLGHTLYGTAKLGGNSGNGTVFKVNIDGTDFTVLHSFAGISEGTHPFGGLISSGNTLYGTSTYGGSSGSGTVFSIFIQPKLTMTPFGLNVILTWPTNYAGFNLQSATNLVSPAWTTNSPAPVVVNGQNTVTNSISGTQQFFRLSR